MIWVTALIPQKGADAYDGVRLQASDSRAEAFRDLAEWLDREEVNPATATEEEITAAMNDARDNYEILLWKIEEQEERADLARADSICKLLWAQNELKRVRDHITPDVAPRAAEKLRSLLKSVEGAIRNAESQAHRANAAKPCPDVAV
jgi:hypothetical protein